jgi:hypothetical protein
MLGRVHELVGNSGCFCIPYTHLRDFYAQIGFEEINLRATPRFPSACYTLYKLELGLDVIIMQRTR